jgi:hypothetical protein
MRGEGLDILEEKNLPHRIPNPQPSGLQYSALTPLRYQVHLINVSVSYNCIYSLQSLQQQKFNDIFRSVSETSSGRAPERRVPGGCTVCPTAT